MYARPLLFLAVAIMAAPHLEGWAKLALAVSIVLYALAMLIEHHEGSTK